MKKSLTTQKQIFREASDNKGDNSILRTSPRKFIFLVEAPQLHIFMRRKLYDPAFSRLEKESKKMMRVELFSLITAENIKITLFRRVAAEELL
jgi:hypothetical protein